MTNTILVVDDDSDQCQLLESSLSRLGYDSESTVSPHDACERAAGRSYAAILTDIEMGEMSGIALCERLVGSSPGVPVIVVTGHGSMETAIAAMRVGAYDFLTKPVDPKLLALSVGRAVQHGKLQSELKRLREEVADQSGVATVLSGDSPAMRRAHDLAARVAPSDVSVLIYGETGTGKEVIARALHAQSSRSEGPFVAINCAALPAQLLESELFGHEKGAFTDAKARRAGLFLEATGGTLFLDEIGEMSLEMQAKLLRALQDHTVRPVGSDTEVPFDARIVTATHRDLETEIAEQRFRQDLYYRINVVRIDLPPLRERGSDVLRLATHFLDRLAQKAGREPITLSRPVAERLLAYDWPGNVRELENCMERAFTLARFDQVTLDELPEKVRAHRPDRLAFATSQHDEIVALDELERRYIAHVIKLVDGNKSCAAKLLGLDRRTLYRRLERYGNEQAASQKQRSSAATAEAGTPP